MDVGIDAVDTKLNNIEKLTSSLPSGEISRYSANVGANANSWTNLVGVDNNIFLNGCGAFLVVYSIHQNSANNFEPIAGGMCIIGTSGGTGVLLTKYIDNNSDGNYFIHISSSRTCLQLRNASASYCSVNFNIIRLSNLA